MRVAFMGTPHFAVPTLQALIESPHDVVMVVAQPDRPAGRGQKLVSPPTIELARAQELPIWQPRAVKSGPFPEAWCALEMDVAVVIAYGRILPERLLDVPRLGCVNVHASILPRYRGAAPIQWAVLNGDAETGITTMQMEAGLDTGPTLLQRSTPIGADETSGTLHDRLAVLGAELLIESLDQLESLQSRPQDHAAASHAPMLAKADGRVNWTRSAAALGWHVRGMSPWPGAFTMFRDERVKIHAARPVEGLQIDAEPGTVLAVEDEFHVATGEGVLELIELQRPGKRRQPARDFISGMRVAQGERFE
jgi:methionyl-tRNA formyltransferase